MAVNTFGSIDFGVPNTGSPVPTLHGDLSVLARLGRAFAPHETMPPSLAVAFDAGALMLDGDLIEIREQFSADVEAPVSYPRIDRAVLDLSSGAISIITGVESVNPSPPSIPENTLPVAQVKLHVGIDAVVNAFIVDERLPIPTADTGRMINVQRFTSSATYTATKGTNRVIVKVQGGGGSGGSCAATTSGQVSCASGGGAGAYAEALLISDFNGVPVIVGNGGAPAPIGDNLGNAGGDSSFGPVIAPGGTPGYGSPAVAPPLLFGGTGVSALPSGANLISAAGATGAEGFGLGTNTVVGGIGGCSVFGGGGRGAGYGDGFPAMAPGAGGGGACAIAGQSAYAGGAGASGLVLVYEYA